MSIVEIAKKAGVSHTTVSRVINRRQGVSQDTVDRVETAMAKMGFTPRPRNSRPGPRPKDDGGINAGQILLLYSYINEETASTSPAAMSLARAIQSTLAELNVSMLVGFIEDGGKLPPALGGNSIDGVIVVGNDPPHSFDKILKKYVCVGVFSNLEEFWGDCVHVDNQAVAKIAVDYLVKCGHQHIALIDIMPQRPVNVIRAKEFQHAAQKAGVSAEVILSSKNAVNGCGHLSPIDIDTATIIKNLCELDPVPTGLFVSSDIFISSLYHELSLQADGFPNGFHIVTLNQNRYSLHGLNPYPGIIDCRPDYIGSRAIEQLLWRLQNPDRPRETILVSPVLVEETYGQK